MSDPLAIWLGNQADLIGEDEPTCDEQDAANRRLGCAALGLLLVALLCFGGFVIGLWPQ